MEKDLVGRGFHVLSGLGFLLAVSFLGIRRVGLEWFRLPREHQFSPSSQTHLAFPAETVSADHYSIYSSSFLWCWWWWRGAFSPCIPEDLGRESLPCQKYPAHSRDRIDDSTHLQRPPKSVYALSLDDSVDLSINYRQWNAGTSDRVEFFEADVTCEMFCFLMGCQDDFIVELSLAEPLRQKESLEMGVPAVHEDIIVSQRRGFAFLRHCPPTLLALVTDYGAIKEGHNFY